MFSTYIHLDASAFSHNIQTFKKIIGNKSLLAVIKSNAYGHGLSAIATLCEQNNNIDMVGVATITEAITARNAGFTKPVLVMSTIDQELECIITYRLTIMVHDIQTAITLNTFAERRNAILDIHLKFDTGLSRLGFWFNNASTIIEKIKNLSHLRITGIASHFAASNNPHHSYGLLI